MPKNRPDRRLVYLAFRQEFVEYNSPTKNGKIRERVLKHSDSSEVQALIQAHNIDNVCQAVKQLSEEGVFQSTLKAKLRFPELFEVSPVQSAEREASEAEAARCESNLLKNVLEARDEREVALRCEAPTLVRTNPPELDETRKSIQRDAEDNFPSPSLYPVYLPLRTQHRLLVEIQASLERACYEFGRKQMPGILDAKGWDCAESVELNAWAHLLKAERQHFLPEDINSIGKPLGALLDSIAHLRHTAVHRLRVTAMRVEQFMVDAESLCQLLRDELRASIADKRRKLQTMLGDMKRNKDLLEAKLAAVRKDVEKRKSELIRLEHAAIAEMLESDQDYQKASGGNFEHELDCMSGRTLPSAAGKEAANLDTKPDCSDEGETVTQADDPKSIDTGKDSLIANSGKTRCSSFSL